ncbi:uncharacterized protein MONOS_15664 [Monocercomonoides exilis]|uniref:uncharacterized protein n=1 Tax=Monocercomonoides exilis TaxID=2049356 RepID=UPI00355A4334|nr:hypothetical protein MONOS_15664 [Monocercomonoides exilis]|eukprot:MONOS_15664.1-p1 / transcript=MONOS_15664.1 / gene=MONOS_15664 / organism=Monocercomonoides_exilis_PA203 / gene_product=unspecified product / transcript_product=unspecified product / location=Mono_scaffold01302:2445-4896(-) / protein_length=478 / sequence_SO=supercontig / SO=protein_coding / is_pseudo=false
MSASQFPPIVGLTPSADSAMQHSGAQSQLGTLSQPDIFSSSSIFSPSSSEGLAQELTPSADRKENDDFLDISQLICQEISPRSVQDVVEEYKTQDFSPLLSLEPPTVKRTENWINDALDQAGNKVEIFLFQAIKAALIGSAEIPTSSEGAKQRLADILIMITRALQEARTVRIQGRMSLDCHSRFPFAVKNQSSNFRELKAVELALTHFAPILAENRISQLQLRSDNSAVVFNVNRWNAGRNLRQTLKRIWTLKEKLKIVLRAVHLPGLRNTRADALSRLERAGDYSIADSELKEILSVLQVTPTLDAFAAQHNHKVDRWCGIGSPLGEDGLAYPWKNECVLAHPPVPLIPMTIRKAQKERVPVVLLLPNWKGQNWDVLLEKTPHRTFEWRSLRTVLRKGPSMASTGACLHPGRLRVILINPPELKARAGGEGRWKKDLSQFHWQRSAYRELLSQRGMDIYSASHTLENSGKRVIWA